MTGHVLDLACIGINSALESSGCGWGFHDLKEDLYSECLERGLLNCRATFRSRLLKETHPGLMVRRTLEGLFSPHANLYPSRQKKETTNNFIPVSLLVAK